MESLWWWRYAHGKGEEGLGWERQGSACVRACVRGVQMGSRKKIKSFGFLWEGSVRELGLSHMLVILIIRHEDSLFSKINYVCITDQAREWIEEKFTD